MKSTKIDIIKLMIQQKENDYQLLRDMLILTDEEQKLINKVYSKLKKITDK